MTKAYAVKEDSIKSILAPDKTNLAASYINAEMQDVIKDSIRSDSPQISYSSSASGLEEKITRDNERSGLSLPSREGKGAQPSAYRVQGRENTSSVGFGKIINSLANDGEKLVYAEEKKDTAISQHIGGRVGGISVTAARYKATGTVAVARRAKQGGDYFRANRGAFAGADRKQIREKISVDGATRLRKEGKIALKYSTKQSLKHTVNTMKNLEGNTENVAYDGFVRTQKTVIRSEQAVEDTVKGVKTTAKVLRSLPTAAKKVKSGATAVVNASKSLFRMALTTVKGMGSLLVAAPGIFLFLLILACIMLMIPTSFGSVLATQHAASPEALSAVFAYITEKSTDVGLEFNNFKAHHAPEFDDVLDEDIVLTANVSPYSQETAKMVNFFSAKYEDTLSLDIAKPEIDVIFTKLFQLSYTEGQRQEIAKEEVRVPVLDHNGIPMFDKNGKPIMKTEIKETTTTHRTLNVQLDGISFDDWLTQNPQQLDDGQRDRFAIFNEMGLLGIGGVGAIDAVGSPFPDGWFVSSGFGYRPNPFDTAQKEFHTGVDLPKPEGTPIYAISAGTVTATTGSSSYGNTFVITTSDGTLAFRYAHCHSFIVTSGQKVEAGQLVGYVGSTGNSTGPHLHVETRLNGTLVNPLLYLFNPAGS